MSTSVTIAGNRMEVLAAGAERVGDWRKKMNAHICMKCGNVSFLGAYDSISCNICECRRCLVQINNMGHSKLIADLLQFKTSSCYSLLTITAKEECEKLGWINQDEVPIVEELLGIKVSSVKLEGGTISRDTPHNVAFGPHGAEIYKHYSKMCTLELNVSISSCEESYAILDKLRMY